MVNLFKLCDKHTETGQAGHREGHTVKFGYDWGGSATAEAADKDPNRRVRTCCYSLACSCATKGHWITGPVDWSNPKSVRGSMWFPKYKTKVMTSIQQEAQEAAGREAGRTVGIMIEIVIIKGGPVSQLELRTLPGVVASAVADLKQKGMDIALAGEFGAEDITYGSCFPLCCFQDPAKKLYSLHKGKKTTTVFLRTYEAAEYFDMWTAQEKQERWEGRAQCVTVFGLVALFWWWVLTTTSDVDASFGPVCAYANDGDCDDPWRCSPGTDMDDCCGADAELPMCSNLTCITECLGG